MAGAMQSEVAQGSLPEFIDKLLPVPHELVSALFPKSKIPAITAAFADIVEHHGTRPWDDQRCRDPEEQLAAEFTQVVNEHILDYVAGKEVSQSEGSTPSSSVAESTGVCHPVQRPRVPGYVMKVLRGSGIRCDRHEAWWLDGGPELEDHAGDEGGDDRARSTAALFRSEDVQPDLDFGSAPHRPHWAHQRAFIHFTHEGAHNDPFDLSPLPGRAERMADDTARGSPDPRPIQRDTWERVAVDNRERMRSQMQSHADRIALYQHRTGVFSLVIGRRAFRVVRWDPSGVRVSEQVDYVHDVRALVEVLLAFVMGDDEGFGYDPSATRLRRGEGDYELMDRVAGEGGWGIPVFPWEEGTPLPPVVPVRTYMTVAPGAAHPASSVGNRHEYLIEDSVQDDPPCDEADNPSVEMKPTTTIHRVPQDGAFVFQYVLDAFRRSLARGVPRYKLQIGSDEFLVGAPLYCALRFGAPCGYVAFHKQSARFVLLKDVWLPQCHGLNWKAEGEILQRLNEDGVRNVPTVVCWGVVGGQKDVTKTPPTGEAENGPRGVKRMQGDLAGEDTRQTSDYLHYRIALKEVCLPLSAVTSSRQLVRVVGDCIEAHYNATEKSGLIHGNISNESIAILPTFIEPEGGDGSYLRVVWRGMLVDWEFATPHGTEPFTPPQGRTPAAWRHMSVASLTDASHIAQTADEIESFFHAVLHHAIRFCPHNVDATDFINTTFVPHTRPSDGAILCPMNKELIVAEHGVLKLRGKKVVFYQPWQSGSPHAPLNCLLATMLRWLKARYDVLEYETMSSRRSSISASASMSASDGDPASERQHAEAEPSGEVIIADVLSVSEEDDFMRPSDETNERARLVDDHEAVRKLFKEVKSMDWPEHDMVEDQCIPQGLRRSG